MADPVLHHVQTRRILLGYRQSGDADGLPMVLLHGSYGTSRWWERLMQVLPNEILAVAPDQRGCGASERAERGYTVPDLSADLSAFVDHLGWAEFDLVAHSSGGAVAMEYALDQPNTVRTLTLIDTVPAEGVFTPVDTYMLLERMRNDRDLLAQALALLMPAFAGPDAEPDAADRAFFQQLVDDAADMSAPAFVAVAEGLSQWNRFAEVARLTLPTLLVWGDQDVIVDRDTTTRTLIAIPGASNLQVLRNVGHSPMIEAPVALAEVIIDFITEDLEDFAATRQAGLDG
jgi:branched-chain amino acid transport system permease protein